MASLISACGKAEIKMPFSDFEIERENVNVTFSKSNALTKGFSEDFVTFVGDFTEKFQSETGTAGLLIDINNNDVMFAMNSFEKRFPASITKVMTCLIALEKCSLDEVIFVTDEVYNISDPTAVKLGLKPGDTLTMDQALHLCLISSYNDVAVAIGTHISGSEEEFCKLMNEEAEKLGATNTHFTDSNGLGSEEHYSSAYDLYLIFNKAVKNSNFVEIIQTKEYQTVYHDKNGNEITGKASPTNRFFKDYTAPETVTVIGGKTGTTDDAGYCLILYVKDTYSNPYIAILMGEDSRDSLYSEMTELLFKIAN